MKSFFKKRLIFSLLMLLPFLASAKRVPMEGLITIGNRTYYFHGSYDDATGHGSVEWWVVGVGGKHTFSWITQPGTQTTVVTSPSEMYSNYNVDIEPSIEGENSNDVENEEDIVFQIFNEIAEDPSF